MIFFDNIQDFENIYDVKIKHVLINILYSALIRSLSKLQTLLILQLFIEINLQKKISSTSIFIILMNLISTSKSTNE